jgi:hypothetical protein
VLLPVEEHADGHARHPQLLRQSRSDFLELLHRTRLLGQASLEPGVQPVSAAQASAAIAIRSHAGSLTSA